MSIGLISAADFNAEADYLLIGYRKLYGTSGSGYGMGEPSDGALFGCASSLASLVSAVYASGNLDEIDDVGDAARLFASGMSALAVFGEQAASLIRAYARHVLKFVPAGQSWTNFDDFLTYCNITGTWAGLQDHFWRDVYNQAVGAYPQPHNCYVEVLQGVFSEADHLYTNGLGKFVATGAGVGTFTHAAVEGLLIDDGAGHGTIDSTKYIGAPKIAIVTSGSAGSDTLTVTATVYDPATKAILTGRTYNFTIAGDGTDSTVVGGTAPANAAPIEVTNMAIGAGLTAGTFYVQAARPAGRTLVQ